MGLWYPGRPPFCSDELIWLLTQLIDTIHELTTTRDTTRIQVAQAIADNALLEIERENETCHGTDRVLNTLRTLFKESLEGIIVAHQKQQWDALFEIAVNVEVVRDELRDEHEKTLQNEGLTS